MNVSTSPPPDPAAACGLDDLTAVSACEAGGQQIVFTFDPDPDQDGTLTTQDPTPFCKGTSGADLNGNGIPDDCESCNAVTGALGPLADVDGDMFLNGAATPGTACFPVDNCTWTANDQRNCNSIVEAKQGVTPLGDVCDPHPCMLAEFNGSAALYTPDANQFCVFPQGPNTVPLNVWPLAEELSSTAATFPNGPANWCSTANLTPVTANTTLWMCLAPTEAGLANCKVDDSLASNPTSPAGHTPWLEMSVSAIDNGAAPNPGQDILYNVDPAQLGSAQTWAWNWKSDFQRWGLSTNVTELHGLLWVHTEPNEAEDPLANSYSELTILGPAICPRIQNSPQNIPVSCLDGNCNMLLWTVAVVNPDPNTPVAEQSVIVPTLTNGYAALNAAVTAVDITSQLGVALRARLSDTSLVWATSAEPALDMGVGVGLPMAAALSADGTRLVDTATSVGGQLLARGDVSGNPNGGAQALPNAATAAQPPAMHGFLTTLSRMRAAVYVAGGLDANNVAQPIWKLQVLGGTWSTVGSFVPRDLKAMTYAYGDSIYMLDAPDAQTARVVAVDSQSGAMQELGRWPADEAKTIWDRAYLTTDYHGELVLAQSSSVLDAHRIVHIPLLQPTRAMTLERGGGALVYQPLADRSAISIVVLDHKGQPTVTRLRVERRSSATPVTWSQLGDESGECGDWDSDDGDSEHNQGH